DNDIRIRANRDCTLLWKKAEDFRCRCGGQLHEPVQADSFLNDTAIVDETHAVLDSWTAVGDLAEIVAAEFLLFLETERTVVGRDHLKIITPKALPQLLLIRFVPQWRRHHIFRPFETFLFVVAVVEEQILWAGFCERG